VNAREEVRWKVAMENIESRDEVRCRKCDWDLSAGPIKTPRF
jgi:hypothetical protein